MKKVVILVSLITATAVFFKFKKEVWHSFSPEEFSLDIEHGDYP